MESLRAVAGIFFVLSLMLALPACESDGPAEQAGESVDRAVDQAGEAVEEAGEDAQR